MDTNQLKDDIIFQKYLRGMEFTFHSTWGIFSPRDVDAGSRLLIEYMEIEEDDICLDLGCGYGPIGLTMAKLAPAGQVYMVDTNFVAVEYARKNAQINGLNNCKALLSNAFSHIPENVKFDVIVSNIPANVGREMLSIILSDAKEYLKDSGRFYVVTISGLRDFIKKNFRSVFGNYKKVKQGRSYAVAMAELIQLN